MREKKVRPQKKRPYKISALCVELDGEKVRFLQVNFSVWKKYLICLSLISIPTKKNNSNAKKNNSNAKKNNSKRQNVKRAF
jgi:hypothetical protein